MNRITRYLDKLFAKPKTAVRNSFGTSSVRGGGSVRPTGGLEHLNVAFNLDGSIRIGLNTYFTLLQKNATLSTGIRFLSNKVGGYGFYFVDKNGKDVTKGQEANKKKVEQFFAIPKIRSYIYTSICYYILSGQKVSTATEMNVFGKATPGSTINLLDPRMLNILTDSETGELEGYEYRNNFKTIKLEKGIVNNDILYPSLDLQHYGQSQIDSIAVDALTDLVMSTRQFNFYRNNASPGTVFLLDSEVVDDETKARDLDIKINEKFGGASNNGKPLITTAVKDVKTIEVPDIKVLEERELIMKILTMVVGVDPRVLGYMKETGGSYSEIDAIARNLTNAKLEEWTSIIEDNMNDEYAKFVGEIPYRIKLDTIYFKNTNLDKEMTLKEIQAGVRDIEEYKVLYDT